MIRKLPVYFLGPLVVLFCVLLYVSLKRTEKNKAGEKQDTSKIYQHRSLSANNKITTS